MINIIRNPKRDNWSTLFARPQFDDQELGPTVLEILEDVKKRGDQALMELTKKFDQAKINDFKIPKESIRNAEQNISVELKGAIRLAADNIEKFHAAQLPKAIKVETMPGVICEQRAIPIEKVGLYIPGGSAPLFSTILMLGIPAKSAGCGEIIICTPPNPSGSIDPVLLYTANLIGIKNIYSIGGAQAIAAMAFGTKSIPKVDKIFGPGNQYVTSAKQQVSLMGTAIDLPAGPSEVLVLADSGADPEFVAADLLSQAEHGADSQVIVVVEKEELIHPILAAIEKQLQELPRKEIATEALKKSQLILTKDRNESVDLINAYAPEHLILSCADADKIADRIKNAGSIFLGYYTPESAGDYASGTNHTLPTNGFARSYSGVNMDAFFKKITYQRISKTGLKNLGAAVEIMAKAEQLVGHQKAISVRLAALDKENSEENKFVSISSDSVKINPVYNLVRTNILNLEPYSSARSEFSDEAEIWLDANEFSTPSEVNRYPDPNQKILKEKIGSQYSVAPENIFVGNGSDEAIDLILRIFCEPGIDSIITLPPTYGMYKVAADIQNVKTITIPLLENFELDVQKICAVENSNAKVLFICNPNNPTGNLLQPKDIEIVLDNFPGIVVIDQAYIEFAADSNWINRLKKYPRLILLQTFSKAWGAAGIRLGMAIANPTIIQLMNKVKAPYNLSALTINYALEQLDKPIQLANNLSQVAREKKWLTEALMNSTAIEKIYPSDTNFLLCKVFDADKIYETLIRSGIVVRNKSKAIGCENCLRFTIGTAKENQKLVDCLSQLSTSFFSDQKQLTNS